MTTARTTRWSCQACSVEVQPGTEHRCAAEGRFTPFLADQVAYASEKARIWTTYRDELIRQMRDEGASLRAIGKAAGMSHGGIRRVLARGEKR